VGGTAVDQGQRHHEHHRDQDQQGEEQEHPVVRERGQRERTPVRIAVPEVEVDQPDHDDRADDPLELGALTLTEDIGAALLQQL
jgi:hypothetical protein